MIFIYDALIKMSVISQIFITNITSYRWGVGRLCRLTLPLRYLLQNETVNAV